MEPIVNFKRARSPSVDYSECIVCQESTASALRQSREPGLTTLKQAAHQRRNLGDSKNIDAINRIINASDSPEVIWHAKCYGEFTHSGKIKRLESSSTHVGRPKGKSQSSSTESHVPKRPKRSESRVNWDLCIFCQSNELVARIISITTKNMSKSILGDSKFDHIMSIRLASINDLMAAEGKYHLTCLREFQRKIEKIQKATAGKDEDLAKVWLCSELKQSAQKGHVLKMQDVFARYCELCQDKGMEIPQRYVSRITSFKEDLIKEVSSHYNFIRPQKGQTSDRHMLLIPVKYANTIIAQGVAMQGEDGDSEDITIPLFKGDDDIFLSMIHVALKLRNDILIHPSPRTGFQVSTDNALAWVPDSIYMFLRVLLGGQSTLDEEVQQTDAAVLSLGQDLVYSVSDHKLWPPKQIGLACTVHQATRSKELVQLLHTAGHSVGYDDLLRIDTALAKHTLETMNMCNGAVVPRNFVVGRFTHFTVDNIDINDSTLDGKNTFHATHMAGWQRGPTGDLVLVDLLPAKERTLEVPEAMSGLAEINVKVGKIEPKFQHTVEQGWYDASNSDAIKTAKANDLAFTIARQEAQVKQSWTHFNQHNSKVNPEITTVGFMPIIPAPAHEYDTLNTVVQRCLYVSEQMGQNFTVITVDQALYCKLMELKWLIPEYKEKLIPRLGGLHTSMNFLKVIGQHMQGCGLLDLWVDVGLMGPHVSEQAMAGKHYNKGMRAHKLTLQALWRILLPDVLNFAQHSADDVYQLLITFLSENIANENVDELITVCQSERVQCTISLFITSRTNDPNFQFWWQYMDMVSILLLFTRAQREGNWSLHLDAFKRMLPFFMRYDHTNYARWGAIYLADMHQLPEAVKTEFQRGNFVVKRSDAPFGQVDPDQSQEWLNGIGKKRGGIVGITKTASALNRWALSYNLRSQIGTDTHSMFGLSPDSVVHNETTKGRQQRDNEDEQKLYDALTTFNVFSTRTHSDILQNIVTKDLATPLIQDSLLNAELYGKQQLTSFVTERLVKYPGQEPEHKFHDTLKLNKPQTFMKLYEVQSDKRKSEKEKVMNADRTILHRLLVSCAAGRELDLPAVLQHELMPVPLSLSETNGMLRSGDKSILANELKSGVACPPNIELSGRSILIIDAQALIHAIGKPEKASTFGDLAGSFVDRVLQLGMHYDRIDVTFDRYRKQSIKNCTRTKRYKKKLIRRVIESSDVPLPADWDSFIGLGENKADLACYLSNQLMRLAPDPPGKSVIVAGGFVRETDVQYSHGDVDVSNLVANHEEADTRLVLHSIHSGAQTVVVYARDTDILILLLAHRSKIPCEFIWMMAGTSNDRTYIPVHTIFNNLPEGSAPRLIPFHALTGCDTTSFISGHSKKTALKVFWKHMELLSGLGEGDVTEQKFKAIEHFFCRLYNLPAHVVSVNEARALLFPKATTPNALPPTSDALRFHTQRCHFQSMVWLQADTAEMVLPPPTSLGWKISQGDLVPELISIDPVPASCLQIISCQCTKGCGTLRCRCKKSKLPCTGACKCNSHVGPCLNV